jgi:hypothetical protein
MYAYYYIYVIEYLMKHFIINFNNWRRDMIEELYKIIIMIDYLIFGYLLSFLKGKRFIIENKKKTFWKIFYEKSK